MDFKDIQTAMMAARACAMQMMDNARYIEAELPNLGLTDELKARISGLCGQLIGTKHDVISEIFEVSEIIEETSDQDPRVAMKTQRIASYIRSDLAEMDILVRELEAASDDDPEQGGAFLLLAESAINILTAFKPLATIVDSSHAGLSDEPTN